MAMNRKDHDFAHGPFPPSLRADRRSAVSETRADDDSSSRYVVLRATKYMDDRARELIDQGISVDELYPQLALLGRPAREDASWLYAVESFVVDRQYHADQESFADHSEEYELRIFDDYYEAMDYCEKEKGVRESDFKKQWETRYVS